MIQNEYFARTFVPLCAFVQAVSFAVPGKFLGIVSQDPSDSRSNRLHVDIFRFCFNIH